MTPDDATDPDAQAPVDPLADLLFTLIAAVLPAILLLAPTLVRTRPIPGDVPQPSPGITMDGRKASVIVAGPAGLRLPPGRTGGATVGLDKISDDQDLRDTLRQLASTSTPLVLVVEPDGLESAFLLEPIVATYGPASLAIVRADDGCAETHDHALAEACNAAQAAP